MRVINTFWAISVVLILFTSCAKPPISVVKFTDKTEIEKGDSAKIAWVFQNADKVKFNGEPFNYNLNDSVIISPDKTSLYSVMAYQDDTDSLMLNSIVKVIDNSIQRGPVSIKFLKLMASYDKSEYFRGVLKATMLTEPSQIKCMRKIIDPINKNITLRTIILDDYGNFLSGYSDNNENLLWKVNQNYQDKNIELIPNGFSENGLNHLPNIDIAIALDNSAANLHNREIINQIKKSLPFLSPADNMMFSTFNQNYQYMFALSPIEKALWEFENLELNDANGLNAINKAAYFTVNRLSKGFNSSKVCIIITHNSDNSSIIYSIKDVALLAQQKNIPIYIIGIGNSIDSYRLRYLSSATGGRFYHIFNNDYNQLKDILVEIVLSQKKYYEINLPINETFYSSEYINNKLIFKNFDTEKYDNFKLILKPTLRNAGYQALANFNYNSTVIDDEYKSGLDSLVSLLENNPNSKIKLIGHSSLEGNDEQNTLLSLERANAVKKYLTDKGIASSRIIVKGMADHKPIYFLQSEDWQQKYNRRVELKWLDPSILPYEIDAEILPSELQAQNKVDFWEKKGYKTYYERYIENAQPMYQVKIWGFSTLQEARNALNSLNNRFKKNFAID